MDTENRIAALNRSFLLQPRTGVLSLSLCLSLFVFLIAPLSGFAIPGDLDPFSQDAAGARPPAHLDSCMDLVARLQHGGPAAGLPARQYVILAECSREAGVLPECVGRLSDLVRKSPGRPNLRLGLAYAMLASARSDEAIEQTQQALRTGGLDPEALNLAGSILLESGATTRAAEVLERARQSTGDENPDLRAKAAYNLGLARERSGDFEGAEQAFRDAIRGRTDGGRPEAVEERARLGLARVSLAAGRTAEALEAYHRLSLEAQDVSLTSQARQGEITALIRMGEYRKAEQACRAALSGTAAVPPAEAAALNTLLGRALYGLGAYEDARQAFQASLDCDPVSGNAKSRVVNLVHLANIDWATGRLARANDTYREVDRLGRESGDLSAQADGCLGQGLVAQTTGFWPEAVEFYRMAAELYEAAGERRRLATALNNLGLVRMRQADFEEAASLFQEAIRVFESAGEAPGVALARSNLGELDRRRGRLTEAAQLLEQAGAAFLGMGAASGQVVSALRAGELFLDSADPEGALRAFASARSGARDLGDLDLEWRALFGLGRVRESAGDRTEALRLCLDAVRVLEKRYDELGPPTVDLLFGIEAEGLYQAVIRLLIRAHREDEAFGYLEENRQRERTERLGSLFLEDNPGRQFLADRLLRNQQRLLACNDARKRLRSEAPERWEAAAAEIEESMRHFRDERDNLLREIGRLDGPSDRMLEPTLDIRRICRGIPEDTLLVEYFMTDPELLLFALDTNGLRVFRSPVGRGPLEKSCRELRDLILAGEEDRGSFQKFKELSASLYGQLLGPLREVLGSRRTLGIVPHGELHSLPFSVLIRREPAGGERYLIEDHVLFCLNVRDYEDFLTLRGPVPHPRTSLTGFADADGSLPGSRAELLEAREVFPDAQLFVGSEATEENVRRYSGEVDILVFALHGVFTGEGPLGSYLKLAPAAGEDGILTVAEASRLHLSKSPLVILSACETGLSAPVRGQGMVSLSDAFLAAGAGDVVNTLWKVDDDATRVFMETFYRELGRKSADEALRAAQLAFAYGRAGLRGEGNGVTRGVGKAVYTTIPSPRDAPRDCTHPYFWGGFVAVGGGR
jgi:CHAT domain-containing protein/tetratricopeptide (TPR) repeat protein